MHLSASKFLLEVDFGLKLLLASQSFLIRPKKFFNESLSDDNDKTEILCCFLVLPGRLFLIKEVQFRYINCLKYYSYLEIQNPHGLMTIF